VTHDVAAASWSSCLSSSLLTPIVVTIAANGRVAALLAASSFPVMFASMYRHAFDAFLRLQSKWEGVKARSAAQENERYPPFTELVACMQ